MMSESFDIFCMHVFFLFQAETGKAKQAYGPMAPGFPKLLQKFQHAHWLRTRQLIPNSAES